MKEINLSHKLIIMKKKHESQENNYYIQWNDINGNLVDLELHPWPSLQIDLDFYL